ncbi:MAG: ammonia-forming cytochrome c nitrite reductase subunit c552 [Gimesia chilikensis]|uniref:ammonia-forming cytochrome c nitrite reductase subunit c552 n=1 Tax=Gimesia chilikensis TaxID=2605989 RepID=UPI0037BB8F01
MVDTNVTPQPKPRGRWVYLATIAVTAVTTYFIVALLMNINERKQEAQQHYLKIVELTEDTVDPAEWGKNFPRQYDSYKRTAENTSRRHGGSEAISKLDDDPRLRRIFAGYPFSVDYRERRGHAFMLEDQDNTERVKQFKQPGACLHCHASIIPAYREAGDGDVMKGFEKVCAMPLAKARGLVEHPVSCIDCHDPKSMQLRVTRPGFIRGIANLAQHVANELAAESTNKASTLLPHLTSIHQWAKHHNQGDTSEYDVNTLATRQEMRSFVCGQCHVEYYFKGDQKTVTYPWHKGMRVEQIEDYYDDEKFTDYVHGETGASILKAQHPEFELWNQGIHARSGVSCSDCHMPYQREGAIKISDHQVRSPLLNIARACQTCHRYDENEILARSEAIQDRNKALMNRAEDALIELLDTLNAAKANNVDNKVLAESLALQRKAQWRVDFINAENSLGFHAPQEAARILAEAIDYARQGQLKALAPSEIDNQNAPKVKSSAKGNQ